MRLFKLLAVVGALTVVLATSARGDSGMGPNLGSERDFLTFLEPAAGGPPASFGLLLFRQPVDAQKVVFLDILALGLAPNHSYSLQRATDPTVDDLCTGMNWLTLGRGLVPEAIVTNGLGFGSAHLFRDLASVTTGMRFDIQFRVIDTANPAVVVLMSPCQQFTVSP